MIKPQDIQGAHILCALGTKHFHEKTQIIWPYKFCKNPSQTTNYFNVYKVAYGLVDDAAIH